MSTKMLGTRVPIEEYVKIVNRCVVDKMTVSDWVLSKLYDDSGTKLVEVNKQLKKANEEKEKSYNELAKLKKELSTNKKKESDTNNKLLKENKEFQINTLKLIDENFKLSEQITVEKENLKKLKTLSTKINNELKSTTKRLNSANKYLKEANDAKFIPKDKVKQF